MPERAGKFLGISEVLPVDRDLHTSRQFSEGRVHCNYDWWQVIFEVCPTFHPVDSIAADMYFDQGPDCKRRRLAQNEAARHCCTPEAQGGPESARRIARVRIHVRACYADGDTTKRSALRWVNGQYADIRKERKVESLRLV